MLRRLSYPVCAIILGYGLLAMLYATVTPMFEKPDEHWHFAAAMYLLENGTLAVNTPNAPTHFASQQANQPPLYYITLAPVWRLLGFETLSPGYRVLALQNSQFRLTQNLVLSDNRRLFVPGRCVDSCADARTAAYIGRALSSFCVMLSLVFTALALRRVFPKNPMLIYATLAMIAFNPQVLHISTSVSNDSLTILLMSIGFYLAMRWLQGSRSWQTVALMGMVAGAAVLTKLSGAALGLALGLMLLSTSPCRWRHSLIFGATALLICGWWFVFNTVTYGDPTALSAHLAFRPPSTLQDLPRQTEMLVRSFWTDFGWGNIILSETANLAIALAIVTSLALGLLRCTLAWRGLERDQRHFLLLSVVVAIGIVVLLIRWMTTTIAPHGRLLFPALMPLSLILVIGVFGLRSRRWLRYPGVIFALVLFGLAAWMPIGLIQPAYATPEPVAVPAKGEALATYHKPGTAGTISIHDVALVDSPEIFAIQLAWQVQTPVAGEYFVFVHLLDSAGNVIGQRDTYPGLGNMPFTRLAAGDILHDIYPMPKPTQPVAQVAVGIYGRDEAPDSWFRLDVNSETVPVSGNAVMVPRERIRFN